MPRDRTDVVRRSLFGVGTPPSGNQEDETGERRPKARPNRETAPRGAELSESRSRIRATAATSPSPPRGRSVERTAVTVPTDLLMRVKDAVAVLNGWPHQYTMARFVEEAFTAHLERLKVDLNGGREFPETNRKIRTGRPPGS